MTQYEKRSDFDWARAGEDASPIVFQDTVQALPDSLQKTEPAVPDHPAPRQEIWIGLAILGILLAGGVLIFALIR